MKSGFNDELVDRLYLDFCEAEGGISHPVFQAWCRCEEQFGEISNEGETACINDLFYQTIRYVVDALQVGEGWDDEAP